MVSRLKPTEFLHAVNSSPEFGTVLTSHRMRKLRDEGGGQISEDGKTLCPEYALAYLTGLRLDAESQDDAGGYAAKAGAQITANRKATELAQEIDILECSDPELRDSLKFDLEKFCLTCFPKKFYRAFSEDHIDVIKKAERAVLESGLYAVAMPRGGGKTRICDAAAIWALLFGHRRFVVFFGADEDAAERRLKGIKRELDNNPVLLALFPEICGPLRQLGGQKRRTLRYKGELIAYDYSSNSVLLPHVPGIESERAPGMGGKLVAEGLTASYRGLDETLITGEAVRPDLVILDDPQTAESAKSVPQTAERLRIINGDILGLAGPDTTICGIMPCTVIRPGDLADQILTDGKFPEWDKSRCKLVYKWPDRADLWETEYRSLLTEGDGSAIDRQKRATAYVRANFDVLHRGAVVAWEERYDRKKQVSALQYAYDWRFRDESAFNAEAQQSPSDETTADGKLTESDIVSKINNRPRGEVPDDVIKITAFIDIQMDALFYVVCGWAQDFSGYVLDYGTFPDQRLDWYLKSNLRFTLLNCIPGVASLEEAIYSGLDQLVNTLATRQYQSETEGVRQIDRILIDANWGRMTDLTYTFARQSAHSRIILPSHGVPMTPNKMPFSEHKRIPNERPGTEWKIVRNIKKRPVPYVLIDTNFWKSFIMSRWLTKFGGRGCLSIFGTDALQHRLFATHQTAEAFTRTSPEKGRQIDAWKLLPGRVDNEYFDGLVGCAVGASVEGISLSEIQDKKRQQQGRSDRPRKTLAELAAEGR